MLDETGRKADDLGPGNDGLARPVAVAGSPFDDLAVLDLGADDQSDLRCGGGSELARDRGRKSDIRSQAAEVGDQRTDDSSSKFQV